MKKLRQELVLITGMSGSGKSVALHALEDAGYLCVDNLPPELLRSFVQLEQKRKEKRIAIAMDVRSAASLPLLPQELDLVRQKDVDVRMLFLDASTDTFVQRYSETRRRHPLSRNDALSVDPDIERNLIESIELERQLLVDLRDKAHIIDTSHLRSAKLQSYVKSLISAPAAKLTLMFESFAFKRGIPMHADFVFDMRMLPNPHYENELRDLSGRDGPVMDWLEQHSTVQRMADDIERFLRDWLPSLNQDHRSYVTVAIGCTGGQHRSVYMVEQLAQRFQTDWVTLSRHREQADRA